MRVETAANGRPLRITEGRNRRRVTSIQDAWRVEDEWWRDQPIARTYFDVLLEDGRRMTLFQDAVTEQWYAQRYA